MPLGLESLSRGRIFFFIGPSSNVARHVDLVVMEPKPRASHERRARKVRV